MTYKQLYESAAKKLENNEITLGEYETMIEPLEKEIEQESTPKVDGEYISRSEALDCINWAFSFSRAYELISKLPVVHPKTRTAKWKRIGIIMEGRKYAKDECDCAEAYSCDYCGWQTYLKTKYCPNCACEMEEENEQSI